MDIPDVPNCYLETIGRVSGRPHEIEIWYAARDATVYLMSGGRDRADWVKNLKKNPRIRLRIDGRTFTGAAAVIEGTDEEQTARETVVAKYYGWTGGPLPNAWARESLPVAIRLETEAGT
ncbi:MAG TPA: nitroreductase family deazaflavin-dependent oxidoreductase [Thermomicrobiales bacterium]|jgi:deazaflavin-dependent oxidoreductase (nitroreductase family)